MAAVEHYKLTEHDEETGEPYDVCPSCSDDWPCVYGRLEIISGERDELQDEANGLRAERERLEAHADRLQFCLTQARIVLEHFSKTLVNREYRRWAAGGLIASDMNLENNPELVAELRRRVEDSAAEQSLVDDDCAPAPDWWKA